MIEPYTDSKNLEVRFEGELLIHCGVSNMKRPSNEEEIIALLQNLIDLIKSPTVEDPDLF